MGIAKKKRDIYFDINIYAEYMFFKILKYVY